MNNRFRTIQNEHLKKKLTKRSTVFFSSKRNIQGVTIRADCEALATPTLHTFPLSLSLSVSRSHTFTLHIVTVVIQHLFYIESMHATQAKNTFTFDSVW